MSKNTSQGSERDNQKCQFTLAPLHLSLIVCVQMCPCLIAHVCVWSFTRGSMHFTHSCAGCTYCIWTFHCKALFISLWLWLHRSWLFHIHKLYKKLRCHPVSRGLKLRPPRWEKYRHLFKCYITNLAAGGDTLFKWCTPFWDETGSIYSSSVCWPVCLCNSECV